MEKTKALGCQVVRIRGDKAIVKSWCKKVDEFGHGYGKMKIFYDVCDYKDGELGDIYESFKTAREAVKYLLGV